MARTTRRFQPDLGASLDEILAGDTQASATRRARAAGYTPVDPYPGPGRRWLVACDRCGTVIHTLVAELTDGMDRTCCSLPPLPEPEPEPLAPQAATPRRRPEKRRPLSAQQVLELSRYQAPVPVKVGRFPALCVLCQRAVYVTLPTLRRNLAAHGGAPRELCAHSARDWVEPRPAPAAPAPSERARPPAITHEDTGPVIERSRYEPDQPYPGTVSELWRLRCLLCGALVMMRFGSLRVSDASRDGRPRTRCHHQTHTVVTPAAGRLARAAELDPATRTNAQEEDR